MRRFNKSPIDIRKRECLQNNDQRQGQRHIANDGAKFSVQHDIGAKTDIAKHGVDHAAFCQNHIPRKYTDKIACEKRDDAENSQRRVFSTNARIGAGKPPSSYRVANVPARWSSMLSRNRLIVRPVRLKRFGHTITRTIKNDTPRKKQAIKKLARSTATNTVERSDFWRCRADLSLMTAFSLVVWRRT